MTNDEMREQFEASVRAEHADKFDFELEEDGDYYDWALVNMWKCYQAALRSPAVVGLVEAATNAERRLAMNVGVDPKLRKALAPFTGAGHD